jgi:hypothetical protein
LQLVNILAAFHVRKSARSYGAFNVETGKEAKVNAKITILHSNNESICSLVATCKIFSGSEVLIAYGRGYKYPDVDM